MDPCDDIKEYWAYIRWAKLTGGDISRLSWFWIRGTGFVGGGVV